MDLARACFGLGLAREAVALEAMRAGLGVVPTDRELEADPGGAGRLAEAAGRAAEDCLIAESESTEDVAAAAPPAPETIH